MNNRILSIFGLQGLKVVRISEYYRKVFIYVTQTRKTANCPSCNKRSKTLHDLRKPSTIRHLKVGAKQTFLILRKRRFKCKSCGKTFTERLKCQDKYQRRTKAVDEEVIEALRETSFRGVKRSLGVNYRAQVKLLKRTMKPFESSWKKEKKMRFISIGIDEHSFSGHDMVTTITNLTTPSLKSILEDNRRKTLDLYLSNIPETIKDKITSVCIDMRRMYKYSVKKSLPNAKIVIDHFHVIYDANRRIDEERRITQNVKGKDIPRKILLKNKENLTKPQEKLLSSIFKNYPDLKTYWFVKEELRTIYKQDKREAEKKLTTLIVMMRKQKDRGLSQWADTLEYWQEEILNFHDYRITNAYTEGLHTKLKLVKRIGFGFKKKDVYIRKAALACLPITFLPPFSQ